MRDKSFLGTGWAFPPSFKKEGEQTAMVSNEEDIKQSLIILLSTKPGERVHRPEYGCGIHKMVFEVVNTTTLTIMEDLISKAILMYEPRITLNAVSFDHSREYEGELAVLIDYTVRLTNTRSNMVFPFYFKEGTNLRLDE
ncbi:MAG: GPW/gp25 family protein [Bacteroidales bacterium]|jgi:phage baseplate assembly protein W|nr:GPW/gp25 family protein [Bacteroidales bacterium]